MSPHAVSISTTDPQRATPPAQQPGVVLGLNVGEMMRLHSRYLAREISYEQLAAERARLLAQRPAQPAKKSA